LNRVRALYRRLRSAVRIVKFSARYHRSIRIHATTWVARRSTIRICGGGSIRIGKHCEIHDYAMLLTYGGAIELGDHCSVNPFTIIYGHGGVKIGSGVRIAAHTVIIPANHTRGDDAVPLHRSGYTAEGIRIEDNVWIGAGCRILDGVHIGQSAVIGAGSVVTKSVPARSTVAGVPARVIKQR
jgi:acetyltransferase-like isoleucine patch superfamily enzyme